jgi:hypothetical protein
MSLQKSLYLTEAEQWAKNLENVHAGWGFFTAEPSGYFPGDEGDFYRLLLDWQDQDGTGREAWSETSLDVKLLALAFAVAVLEAE